MSLWGQKGHWASHPMIDSICMNFGFCGNLCLTVTSNLSDIDVFFYQVEAARRRTAASSDESRCLFSERFQKGPVGEKSTRFMRELFRRPHYTAGTEPDQHTSLP